MGSARHAAARGIVVGRSFCGMVDWYGHMLDSRKFRLQYVGMKAMIDCAVLVLDAILFFMPGVPATSQAKTL